LFKQVSQEKIKSEDWEIYFNCLIKNKNPEGALGLALNGKIENEDFFLVSQRTLLTYGLNNFALEKREVFLRSCHTVEFYLRLWDEMSKLKKSDLKLLFLQFGRGAGK
jgi:hypothetical protein